jgi:Subtilase family
LPLIFASAFNANAAQLITNGGFATSLAGWTVTSSAGSGGSWFQDSTIATPLTGMPTVGPASGGTGYAVTDQVLPGVNALSQDYTVPIGTTSLTLTFDMFINDWASATGSANIQVLVLSAGSNPVTGTGTVLFTDDILVSGGVPNPYFPESLGIIGFVPTDTYILDFLETDTMFNMNVGLDDVALNATAPPPTPEPRSVVLLLSALVVMGALGWRRHQGRPLAVLAALALLSQPVHAQNANVARPLVPRSTLGPGDSRPHIWEMSILDPAALVHGPGQTNCNGTGNACYYFPKDVNTAYTTSFISNGNGGTGITVAVVDAYYNTQTESDLGSYISGLVTDFGQPALPACTIADGCLTIVSQTGGAPPAQPRGPPFAGSIAGWFTEENLDVQWVHSIAPNAKILLVIANSNSGADLYTAVEYAKANADVVSNSWGGAEYPGETTDDPVFSSTVPVLFSAGDTFAELEYPCTSPTT